ncbi:MAG: hypothetical protein U1F36_08055 [Planctomycetota bacterium]
MTLSDQLDHPSAGCQAGDGVITGLVVDASRPAIAIVGVSELERGARSLLDSRDPPIEPRARVDPDDRLRGADGHDEVLGRVVREPVGSDLQGVPAGAERWEFETAIRRGADLGEDISSCSEHATRTTAAAAASTTAATEAAEVRHLRRVIGWDAERDASAADWGVVVRGDDNPLHGGAALDTDGQLGGGGVRRDRERPGCELDVPRRIDIDEEGARFDGIESEASSLVRVRLRGGARYLARPAEQVAPQFLLPLDRLLELSSHVAHLLHHLGTRGVGVRVVRLRHAIAELLETTLHVGAVVPPPSNPVELDRFAAGGVDHASDDGGSPCELEIDVALDARIDRLEALVDEAVMADGDGQFLRWHPVQLVATLLVRLGAEVRVPSAPWSAEEPTRPASTGTLAWIAIVRSSASSTVVAVVVGRAQRDVGAVATRGSGAGGISVGIATPSPASRPRLVASAPAVRGIGDRDGRPRDRSPGIVSDDTAQFGSRSEVDLSNIELCAVRNIRAVGAAVEVTCSARHHRDGPRRHVLECESSRCVGDSLTEQLPQCVVLAATAASTETARAAWPAAWPSVVRRGVAWLERDRRFRHGRADGVHDHSGDRGADSEHDVGEREFALRRLPVDVDDLRRELAVGRRDLDTRAASEGTSCDGEDAVRVRHHLLPQVALTEDGLPIEVRLGCATRSAVLEESADVAPDPNVDGGRRDGLLQSSDNATSDHERRSVLGLVLGEFRYAEFLRHLVDRHPIVHPLRFALLTGRTP